MDKDDIIVIGIGGASCGGKSTLAEGLIARHPAAAAVHQDFFFKDDEEAVWNETRDTRLWDVPESLHLDKMVEKVVECVKKAKSDGSSPHLIIIEGTMVLTIEELKPFIKYSWFVTLDNATMKERRSKRDYRGDPEGPTTFQEHVWPCYLRDLKEACKSHKDGSVRMLDGLRTPTEILDEVDFAICELLRRTESL